MHTLLLSSSSLTHLLGQDCLENNHTGIFLPKGRNNSGSDSSNLSSQPGKLNNSLIALIYFVSDITVAESADSEHLFLLDQLPASLWAGFSDYIGRIHSALPIKIQMHQNFSSELIKLY